MDARAEQASVAFGNKIRELVSLKALSLEKYNGPNLSRPCICWKQVFDFVHANLWGPAQVPSLSGGRYFMWTIDDHCRKVWIHVLKTKGQALEMFKVWKALVETQSSFKMKCLRTNNGLEFYNKEFKDFC